MIQTGDGGLVDPVLAAIEAAATRRRAADRELRELVAFAREHVVPRGYRLVDVASAAGVSISGVRTLYGPADVEAARALRVVGDLVSKGGG